MGSEAKALRRTLTHRVNDRPFMATVSWMPHALVADKMVGDKRYEPWPGGIVGRLKSVGKHVSRIRELVSVRLPTPVEAERLEIETRQHVARLQRETYVGSQIFEIADRVFPLLSFKLKYVIDLPTPGSDTLHSLGRRPAT